VAGFAQATVVVEARERSGALITADLALEEGREVFAVPGEITSALSAGTNRLLRLGATPVTSPADVLESFGLVAAEASRPALGPDAERVLERLRDGAIGADELARTLQLDAGALAAALAKLELAGLASEADGLYRV
jgi:DNA processing protein